MSRNGRVFVARESFAYVDEAGNPGIIKVGQRVREGHSLLNGREDLFRLDDTVLEGPEEAPVKRGRPAATKE